MQECSIDDEVCLGNRPGEVATASNFKASRKAVYSFHIIAWILLTIAGLYCVKNLYDYNQSDDMQRTTGGNPSKTNLTYWAFLCVVLSLYSNGIDAMMNVNDKQSEVRDAEITFLNSMKDQSKLNFDIAWSSLSIVFLIAAIVLWVL